MQALYTIASSNNTLANTFGIEIDAPIKPVWQARPGMALPVILQEAPRHLREGFWGFPGPALNFVPVHRILAKKPFNLAIRKQRCALPANGFVGLRETHPYLFTLLNEKLFCLGGIYTLVSGIPRFAILQTSVPALFGPYLEFLPVLLTANDAKEWLTTSDIGRIIELADRSQDQWFDFFRIAPAVLQPGTNNKSLLTPLGEKFSDLLQQQRKAQATVFLERRRRKGKG